MANRVGRGMGVTRLFRPFATCSLAVLGLALACSSKSTSHTTTPDGGGGAAAAGGTGGSAAAAGAAGSGGSAGSGTGGSAGTVQCTSNPNEPVDPTSVAVSSSASPNIASGPCGEFALAWVDQVDKHVYFATTWTLTQPLDLGKSNGAPPRVAYTGGHSWAQRRYLVAWIQGSSANEGTMATSVVRPGAGTHIKTDADLAGGSYRHPNALGVGNGRWLLSYVVRPQANTFEQWFTLVNTKGEKEGSALAAWTNASDSGPGTFSSLLNSYTFAGSVDSEVTAAADAVPPGVVLSKPAVSSVSSMHLLRSADSRPHVLQTSGDTIFAYDSPGGVSVLSTCSHVDQVGAMSSLLGLVACGAQPAVALIRVGTSVELRRVNINDCMIAADSIPFTGLSGAKEATVASSPESLAVAWTDAAGALFVRVANVSSCN